MKSRQSMPPPNEIRKFKVVVNGDANVGKTTLLRTYKTGKYEPAVFTDYDDMWVKQMEVNGEKIGLQLWDPCGQERFQDIAYSFYRGANFVLICVGLGRGNMYERETAILHVKEWNNEINKKASPYTPRFIVATASDTQPDFTKLNTFDILPPEKVDMPPLFASLPTSILHHIFMYLSLGDLGRCSRLNRTWFRVLQDETLWNEIFHYYFKYSGEKRNFKYLPTWQQEYKHAKFYSKFRFIRRSDVEDLGRVLNIPVYFTSAKKGINVEKVFEDVAYMLATGLKPGDIQSPPPAKKKGFFSALLKKK